MSCDATRWVRRGAPLCALVAGLGSCAAPEDGAEQLSSVTGSLAIEVAAADELQYELLQYQLQRVGGGDLHQGAIAIEGNGRAARRIEALAPGQWQLRVSPLRDHGFCESSVETEVRVGMTTVVALAVRCAPLPDLPAHANDAVIPRAVNTCPRVVAVWALPAQATLGSSVVVAVEAVDRDGNALQYAWRGGAGMLSSPNAPVMSFVCTRVGRHQLTVSVADTLNGIGLECTKQGPELYVECMPATSLLDAAVLQTGQRDAGEPERDAMAPTAAVLGIDAQVAGSDFVPDT